MAEEYKAAFGQDFVNNLARLFNANVTLNDIYNNDDLKGVYVVLVSDKR
jgi:hypothetical protein